MTTTTTVRIRLASGVRLATGPASENQAAESSDDIALQSDSGRMTASSPAMRALFRTLGSTGLPVSGADADPHESSVTSPGLGALSRRRVVERLSERGWAAYEVDGMHGRLAVAVPVAGSAAPLRIGRPIEGPVVLSRFATARITPDGLCLESPLAQYRVQSSHPGVLSLLAELGSPTTLDELTSTVPLWQEEALAVLGLLAATGLLCRVGPDGSLDEDADLALRQWEPHDLAFHARTRTSLTTGRTGATYRFRGSIEPLPAVKPRGPGRIVTLEPAPVREHVAFDDVLRRRRSVRDHDPDRPIGLRALGHLLHRAARITSIRQVDGDHVVSRPYPSGGALHELELYLVVTRCDGLDPGVYHYQAADHELEHVADPSEASDALLAEAGFSTGTGALPQILVVVAARFPRLSWKYESIAYSLVLKHVGCLLQTLYLVATSMDLAPCGIGGGDSAQFARVVPGSRYLETSVGEFVLGAPAPNAATLHTPETIAAQGD